jgi:hypothetical protein
LGRTTSVSPFLTTNHQAWQCSIYKYVIALR